MKQIKFIFLLLILIFNFNTYLFSIENKILVKIDNEIITTLDIFNESKYLILLNPKIQDLNENEIYNIAKNNLIREIIKKKEILSKTNKIEIQDKYLDEIIKSSYPQLNISSYKEFEKYLKSKKILFENLKEKVSIEIIWNQMIYNQFISKVKINKNELIKNVKEISNSKIKSYLLSEIIFKLDSGVKLEDSLIKIKTDIEKLGFNNAASIHSISSTSSIGGNLGWIDETALNFEISSNLQNLNIGQYSKPILTPSGFLILKIDDIKNIENKIDVNKEIEKLVKIKTNQQLNQYSNIYFNKITKKFYINEL